MVEEVDWKIFQLQSSLLCQSVSEDIMEESAQWLQPRDMYAVVIERNNEGRCGLPICSNPLSVKPQKKIPSEIKADECFVEIENVCSEECLNRLTKYCGGLDSAPAIARSIAKSAPLPAPPTSIKDIIEVVENKSAERQGASNPSSRTAKSVRFNERPMPAVIERIVDHNAPLPDPGISKWIEEVENGSESAAVPQTGQKASRFKKDRLAALGMPVFPQTVNAPPSKPSIIDSVAEKPTATAEPSRPQRRLRRAGVPPGGGQARHTDQEVKALAELTSALRPPSAASDLPPAHIQETKAAPEGQTMGQIVGVLPPATGPSKVLPAKRAVVGGTIEGYEPKQRPDASQYMKALSLATGPPPASGIKTLGLFSLEDEDEPAQLDEEDLRIWKEVFNDDYRSEEDDEDSEAENDIPGGPRVVSKVAEKAPKRSVFTKLWCLFDDLFGHYASVVRFLGETDNRSSARELGSPTKPSVDTVTDAGEKPIHMELHPEASQRCQYMTKMMLGGINHAENHLGIHTSARMSGEQMELYFHRKMYVVGEVAGHVTTDTPAIATALCRLHAAEWRLVGLFVVDALFRSMGLVTNVTLSDSPVTRLPNKDALMNAPSTLDDPIAQKAIDDAWTKLLEENVNRCIDGLNAIPPGTNAFQHLMPRELIHLRCYFNGSTQ